MIRKVVWTGLYILLWSVSAAAGTIPSLPEQAAKVDAAGISKTVILESNAKEDIFIRAVEIYIGQRPDVTAPIRLLLTYFNGAEINNTRTAFDLGRFMEISAYKRLGAGLYRISGTTLSDRGNLEKVVVTINAAKVFIDDKKTVSPDFTDPYFSSTLQVTQTIEKNTNKKANSTTK